MHPLHGARRRAAWKQLDFHDGTCHLHAQECHFFGGAKAGRQVAGERLDCARHGADGIADLMRDVRGEAADGGERSAWRIFSGGGAEAPPPRYE